MEDFPAPPQEGYDPKLTQVVPHLGADELAVAAEAAATAASEMHQETPAAAAPMEGPPLEAAAPAPVVTDSLPAFTDLNGGGAEQVVPAPVGGMDPQLNQHHPPGEEPTVQNENAFLQSDEQYEGQYTSTDVPVPPMMDWSNNTHTQPTQHEHEPAPVAVATPAPAQMNNTMELHSPIHAPAEAPPAPVPPPNPAEQHHHHHHVAPPAPQGEPIYTSYAIPPGTQPQPHQPMHHHPGHQHPIAAPMAATMPHPHYDPNAQHHHMYAQWPHMGYPPPHGQMPPYAAPVPPRPPQNNVHHNSNFWLQEEEERFLLGLRLYGWGQWKRIQTVVQTRSNKQIKSHAQKREKVNPEIKFKYAKGKSRRGRLSTKVATADGTAYTVAVKDESNMGLDDPSLPPMEELWKDVYGTNNGVGPNSRLRRYRSNALHQKWLEEVADKPESEKTVATEKTQKEPSQAKEPSKKKLSPEGQYIQDHKVLERHAHAPQPSPGPPMPYYNPQPHPHYAPHPGYGMPPPPGVSPARMQAPQPYPPPPTYHHPPVAVGHHSQNHHGAPAVHHPPIVHQPAPVPVPPTNTAVPHPPITTSPNDEPLRPGMRVYARNKNSSQWSPGVIYSAKVDPNKTIADSATVPLVYHVQYDGGGEDPEVQEEYILGKIKYEKALEELEAHYELTVERKSPLLEPGVPVYARWMDRSNPTSHGRWLPGTVGSVHKEDTPSGPVDTYHILFDNAAEKNVAVDCVLDRNEYHEQVNHKKNYPSRIPIGEIYNLFSRGNAASGQGMDLLFTASQMAAPMAAPMNNLKTEPEPTGGEPPQKKAKVESQEQQTEGAFALL